jgi:hypothetical protein
MSAVLGKFVDWIRKEVSCITEEGGVRCFVLMRTVGGEWRARLMTFEYDPEQEQEHDEIAQTIWDAAEQDAETGDGLPQSYAVVCFRKDEQPYSQFPLTVTVASLRQAMLMGSESGGRANEAGVIGQQLRHTEALFRLFTVGSGDFNDRLLNENRRLHESLDKAQSRQIDLYELMETLNERKHERELEREQAARKAEQHEKLINMLMTFVPALLAQIMQSRMPMAEKAFRDDAFINFLSNLDQEELAGAFRALSPSNQAALAELYKSARATVQPTGDTSNGGKKE